MENNNPVPSANGEQTIATNRKTIERSAAYPGITIEAALELVTKVYKGFSSSAQVRREDVAAVAGENDVSRDVAAAVQYGLLTRDAGLYKIADLFFPLYQPVEGSNERADALITAFTTPKLYKELLAKYDKHAVPTLDALSIVLFRHHSITEKASKQAAEIFLANAKFVGAINSFGILNTSSPVKVSTESSEPKDETTEVTTTIDQPNNQPEIKIIDNPNLQTKILGLPDGSVEEKIVIPLTEKKKAVLIYPSNFNSKDLEVIKRQLDVLELLLT